MEDKLNTLDKLNMIIKQFLLIILYIFLSVMLQIIFYKYLTSNNLLLSNLVYIFIDLVILIVFLFLFRKIIIPNFEDFKKNGRKYIKDNFKYYLIGLIIMVVSNLIISSFISMPSNEAANREIINTLPYYAVIGMVIIAPITEELLTRALLKDTFKHYYIYVLLSGLIFGSLHMITALTNNNYIELLYIIPYGSLGCALALMYKKSNNIWTNIFYHSLHNFICLLILFLGSLL